MRAYRGAAPAWLMAAVYAVCWAGWMALWGRFGDHHSWGHEGRAVAIMAVPFGVAMWWIVFRPAAAARDEALAAVPPERRRDVLRAVVRGVAPDDPLSREAAARVVENRLATSLRHRTPVAVLLGVLLVVGVVAAIVESLWWCLGALVVAWVLFNLWRTPRRLRRRHAELRAPAGVSGGGGFGNGDPPE